MDLEDYQQRGPQVTAVDDHWLRAFVGDQDPRRGDALQLRGPDGQRAYGVVQRHAGGRQVDAMLIGRPDWLDEQTEVSTTDERAYLPELTAGDADLGDLAISAGPSPGAIPFGIQRPAFERLRPTRPAMCCGLAAIDRLAPLAAGGVNLVLDAYPNPRAFDGLAERVGDAVDHRDDEPVSLWLAGDDRPAGWADHQLRHRLDAGRDDTRHLCALRVLLRWAGWLRDQDQDVLVCADLPALTADGAARSDTTSLDDATTTARGMSVGQVIDRVGSALASTDTAAITTVLRLPLHASAAGIETIIETMNLGGVDAQLFVDDQGRFDPYRSNSDADLDDAARSEQRQMLSVLSRAAAARDKAAMMGDFGLTDAEKQALDQAEALGQSLVDD